MNCTRIALLELRTRLLDSGMRPRAPASLLVLSLGCAREQIAFSSGHEPYGVG